MNKTFALTGIAFCICATTITCNNTSNNTSQSNSLQFVGYEDKIHKEGIANFTADKFITTRIDVSQDIADTAVLDLDSLIENIEYVPLETGKDFLIGSVDKLIVTGEKIIICDFTKASAVFIFDSKGKFLKKITSHGDGDQHLKAIRDVSYDNSSGQLLLYDDFGRKINYYTSNGKFLHSIKTYYYFLNLACLEDGALLTKATPNINLHIGSIGTSQLISLDSNKNIIAKGFDPKQKFPNNELNSSKNFRDYSTGTFFTPLFSDTIFEITSAKKMIPKYHINLGEKNIVNNIDGNITTESFMAKLQSGKFYYFEGYCVENSNCLYLEVNNGDQLSLFRSSNTGSIHAGKFTQSRHRDFTFFNFPKTSINGEFVSSIAAQEILNRWKALGKVGKSESGKGADLVSKISLESNPVIMFYRVNESI